MHDLYIWGLSLTLVGFVLLAMMLVTAHYRKLFVEGETSEYDAEVTDLKKMTSKPYSLMVPQMVTPIVEYSFEGRLIKAHHYIQVPEDSIHFRKGDIITIEVNPKQPKVFRLRSAELFALEERMKKNSVIVYVLGGIVFLAGIIMLTVTLLS